MFSEHSSHGSIELSRFSGWGIVKWIRSVVAPQYSAQVYYANDIPNIWNVLIAIRCRRGLDVEDTVGVEACGRHQISLKYSFDMCRSFVADWSQPLG